MANHRIYRTIVQAVKDKKLGEPFSANDVMKACRNLKPTTCMTFLNKHRKSNPSQTSELFVRVSPGKFKLIRPIRYGLSTT